VCLIIMPETFVSNLFPNEFPSIMFMPSKILQNCQLFTLLCLIYSVLSYGVLMVSRELFLLISVIVITANAVARLFIVR
jgi:hypothetical protein